MKIMLNLIFQSNPGGNNAKMKPSSSSSPTKTMKSIETKESQRKCLCDKSEARSSKSCSRTAKSMPSIIAIATIIASLLMGVVSIFCIIKVEQNAENLFQSFMQNKVFVNRVENIVQSYIEQKYPGGLGRTTTTTTTTTTATKGFTPDKR